MARDGTETRTRLLMEAERLFAEVGVWQAATGDIVRSAGQRNASALTYHFGSRQGALDAILAEHGANCLTLFDAVRRGIFEANLNKNTENIVDNSG